ncbi:MAG TPA: aldehyde dehydrogenase family protein [Candidatus Polarisedimenticolia bacterium]|nr:aldehyde dehydrogenase family protein [Candidatus Polarisedimenticolia bacterium]
MTSHDSDDRDLRSIREARRLVESAALAAARLASFSQEQLDAVLDALHAAALPQAEPWARMAVEETGFGNVADKILKNRFATADLHRHIRPMRTVGILRQDDAAQVVEIAAPVGVVAAIIPSTNPTSTAIYKILIALKAGNAVVLSPHPRAQRCVGAVARTLAEAAVGAGAPPGAIACMTEPAIEGTNELMRHPAVGVILATGGTGLVRAAYSSGKPAFGVGPGNVPAFVERSADIGKAARDIVAGKSFDHGVLCSSENAVVADRPIAGALEAAMAAQGARFLDETEAARLAALAVAPDGSLNTSIVGRAATAIAAMAGIEAPEGTRCLVARLQGVGKAHPLSREKLSPILAFYTEDGWEACCERVLEILRYGGMGHTMSIHSRDRDIIMKFALAKPVFRICVNTPASVGAVGVTTGLEPSMTLGCGALGGNITSDNIMPRHLLNVKRLAFEIRPFAGAEPSPTPRPEAGALAAPALQAGPRGSPALPERPGPEEIRERVARALARRPPGPAVPSAPQPGPASHQGAGAARTPAAVPFVSEADVRQALLERRRIPVDRRTIITPSARDLGQEHHVFLPV